MQREIDTVSALREILKDPGVHADERSLAAGFLALTNAEGRRDAITALRAVLDEPGYLTAHRRAAAQTLAAFDREHRDAALAVLWALVHDSAISTRDRIDAAWDLINVDISHLHDVVAQFAAVVADTTAQTVDRCRAGEHLVRLARHRWSDVVNTFHRLLRSPYTTPQDRLYIVDSLAEINAVGQQDRIRIVLTIADDPMAKADDRHGAAERLLRYNYRCLASAREIQRELLADRNAPVPARLVPSQLGHIASKALRSQEAAALREVLTGPEFNTKDRLDALAALATLGSEYKNEAAQGLRAMDHPRALIVLGEIDGRHRLEAISRAENIADRQTAAEVTMSLHARLSESAVEFLLGALRAGSVRDSVKIAGWLAQSGRREQAITVLHQIVHDPQVNAHTRQIAARALVRWSPGERTKAVQVLETVAGNWHVAKALAILGYRDRAITHLRAIMNDPNVHATARIHAADELKTLQPQDIEASTGIFRAVAYAPSSSQGHRILALLKLGSISRAHCDEAVDALREIANDTMKDVTARCRAVRAMVKLRRDTREEAALIVSAVARNPEVSWHIRRRAACALARWSPANNAEARGMLEALRRH